MLSKQDTEFLQALGEELAHQNAIGIDCQAFPQYWGIMDYRRVPANEDYDNCKEMYYHSDGDFVEFETYGELKEFIECHEYPYAHEYLKQSEVAELKRLLSGEKIEMQELWGFVINYMNDNGFYDSCPMKEESFLRKGSMFITKYDALDHLKNYRYNYSERAHTYAMTAFRSPKYERLLKILANTDWSALFNENNPK